MKQQYVVQYLVTQSFTRIVEAECSTEAEELFLAKYEEVTMNADDTWSEDSISTHTASSCEKGLIEPLEN